MKDVKCSVCGNTFKTEKRKTCSDDCYKKCIRKHLKKIRVNNSGKPMSEKTKQKLSYHRKYINHPTAKKCMVGNKVFNTITEAAKYLGITPIAFSNRVKSKGFNECKYV